MFGRAGERDGVVTPQLFACRYGFLYRNRMRLQILGDSCAGRSAFSMIIPIHLRPHEMSFSDSYRFVCFIQEDKVQLSRAMDPDGQFEFNITGTTGAGDEGKTTGKLLL